MIANLKHAIRNNETVTIGGGEFSPAELKAFLAVFDDLLDAACTALPFIEDAADDHCYKEGAAKKVEAKIRAAIAKGESA